MSKSAESSSESRGAELEKPAASILEVTRGFPTLEAGHLDAGHLNAAVSPSERAPRVVAFGGGTGMAALLRGLRLYTDQITAVVTVTDDGGSSGRLRNDFDIVAPGDVRNCLMALADVDPLINEVFQYRFSEAEFKGHCFGNLFITVLARVVGDFAVSIRELNRLLRVKGRVVPATSAKVSLVAHHPDGTKSTGETQITKSGKPIVRVEIRPSPIPLSDGILQAVAEADFFIFGPGSLYTSVIPNLLIAGLVEAIQRTGKPRIYVGNIMTQPGETTGYALSEHIRALRRHVGNDFPDVVVAHSAEVPEDVRDAYVKTGSLPVVADLFGSSEFAGIECITRSFLPPAGALRGVPAASIGAARHDSVLLARVLFEEVFSQRGFPAARGTAIADELVGIPADRPAAAVAQTNRPQSGSGRLGALAPADETVSVHGTRVLR